MLNKKEETYCARCEKRFECKPEDISSCDCSKVELSKEEYHFINARFKKCVCNACLVELKAECHKAVRYTKPTIFKDRSFGFFLVFTFLVVLLKAQTYAPPVGQPGTTAIYKDSNVFVNWVKSCSVTRGYQDISNIALGLATTGDSTMAIGKPDQTGIVSLGDGGSVICQFEKPISNGTGYDFAVFENGFDDVFLELAFVEVSSDGINYIRFPAHSLTDTITQTAGFGSTNATKINNLAGKYRGGYGTPFDLQDLAGSSGLDLNNITHVKIIDVVGSINKAYASRDAQNNMINDPWPTPFPSSGFDLDAIGVIHENSITSLSEIKSSNEVKVYPNPCLLGQTISFETNLEIEEIEVLDNTGFSILKQKNHSVETHTLNSGIYIFLVKTKAGIKTLKLLLY
jgi:hypothetical protein